MPEKTEVVKTDSEEFAAAFAAEVAQDVEQTEQPAAEGEETTVVEGEEAVAVEGEEAVAAEGEEAVAAEGEETPAAEGEETPAVEQSQEKDYKAEAERLAAELEVLKKAPAPVAEPTAPEPTAEKAPQIPTAETVLTDEELGVVATYEDEWADVSRAEGLKRKVEMAIMKDEIYREVAVALQSILGTVNPIVQSAQQTANEKHYAAIAAAHPDYEEVTPKVESWILTQPKYLQAAMNAVMDSGSAAEVNDLYSRYKQETGSVAPQVKSDQPLLQNKPAVDAAVVQALTPVKGGRGAPVTPKPDANDFEGAWQEAVASAK